MAKRSGVRNPGGFAKWLEPRKLNSFGDQRNRHHRRIKAEIDFRVEVCQNWFYSPLSVRVLDGGRSTHLIPATGLKQLSKETLEDLGFTINALNPGNGTETESFLLISEICDTINALNPGNGTETFAVRQTE